MADSLSQKEIDRLLNDMSSGALSIDQVLSGAKKKSEITNYDFRRPNRISKNQVRTLQNIHENFAEVFSYYLVSKLQTVVSIELTGIDQLFYSEFILSVSTPGCLYIFDVEGADGSGILEVSPSLALNMVERLLGGEADSVVKPRTITPIEQSVVRNVIEHGFRDLSEAWKVLSNIRFKYDRMETEADFVQVAPSSEIVIVVSFDVIIGQNSFSMAICYPTFALEEQLTKLNKMSITTTYGPGNKDPEKSKHSIKKQVEKTYLPVSVELGRTKITIADLLDLQVGDVLKSDKKITDNLEVSIDGHKKLHAKIGNIEGKKAVKIIDKIKKEDIVDLDTKYQEEK